LEEAIVRAFASSLPGETGSSLVAINARHQHELGLCLEHVRLASESISRQESPEFTALELREALTHLGEITGAVDTEDVLGAIFSSFCLGK
jgi:tRNA modification GTPase mnmE